MARYTPVKIATLDLAALAFAAFRKNNNQVFKDTSFYDKERDTIVSVVPNKALMREGNLMVNDQDRADAVAAFEILSQDRTLRVLKNQPITEFQNILTNLIVGTEVSMSDAGLMAFLPNMANQIKARQQREEEIAGLSYTSEFLGKIGDKVKFTLSVMTSRWSDQFNCWAVNGKDENGNLVTFFTSKQICTKDGVYTGKIKRTEQSRFHNNAKVTTLNFVTVVQ